MPLFKLGGVHVPHRKHTASLAAVRMPAPESVAIPVSMHIGAPAVPCVKVGDTVQVGQVIAEAGGFVSSPVHASVSGKVRSVDGMLISNGKSVPAIVIDSDGEMTEAPLTPPDVHDFASFVEAVRASGVVGLGGAGFPTAVKLGVRDLSQLRHVVVNGAECEPYITSDTRTMLDRTEDIAYGVALLETYLGAPSVIFGIENNKPECVRVLRERFAADNKVSVMSLPALYPQGGEKMLVYHTTGRIIEEGKLPFDCGVIVLNVTTLAALADYVRTGKPLVEKCVTVDGGAIREPKNVIAPIGTPIKALVDFCGGYRCPPAKILYGGPMMGITVYSDTLPVLKNTNAVLAFDEKEAAEKETTACIRCGACVNHCPMRLDPPAIARAFKNKDAAALSDLKIRLCMECGACAYICPAGQPIVQRHKLAKVFLNEKQAAEKAAAETRQKAKEAKEAKEAEKAKETPETGEAKKEEVR